MCLWQQWHSPKHSIWNLPKIFGLSLHNNKNCQNVSVFLHSDNHLSINQSSLINQGYNTTLSECVTKGLSGEDPCSCFMVTSCFLSLLDCWWYLLLFRSPNWWGRWQIWGPARGKTRRSWRPSRGPSVSTRWELAMAMLRRYYQLLRIGTIISW